MGGYDLNRYESPDRILILTDLETSRFRLSKDHNPQQLVVFFVFTFNPQQQ